LTLRVRSVSATKAETDDMACHKMSVGVNEFPLVSKGFLAISGNPCPHKG
jgi:hypothetical protein